MKDCGPSESSCGGRLQTASCCVGWSAGSGVDGAGDSEEGRNRARAAPIRACLAAVHPLAGRGDPGAAFFMADLPGSTRAHILAAAEHATRRIRILGVTQHPAGGRTAQHARNLIGYPGDQADRVRFMYASHAAASLGRSSNAPREQCLLRCGFPACPERVWDGVALPGHPLPHVSLRLRIPRRSSPGSCRAQLPCNHSAWPRPGCRRCAVGRVPGGRVCASAPQLGGLLRCWHAQVPP
jgi:hypothetical protein